MGNLDKYLEEKYSTVAGMSSKLSINVTVSILRYQSESRISGPIAEIGVYEGRFFIGMALSVEPGERCVAVDTFKWPDEEVYERFMKNCLDSGVEKNSIVTKRIATRDLTPWEMGKLLGEKLRFIHIDGAHSYEGVSQDLRIAHHVLRPDGIICLDDVLHPLYPELTVSVSDFLKSHPDLRVFSIIDRESFVSACKYLICREGHLKLYQEFLLQKFPDLTRGSQASFHTNKAIIVSTER